MKPETYWEKRCTINENALLALLTLAEYMAPQSMLGDGIFDKGPFEELREKWGDAIYNLDKEHADLLKVCGE